jgi:hypothetical protein
MSDVRESSARRMGVEDREFCNPPFFGIVSYLSYGMDGFDGTLHEALVIDSDGPHGNSRLSGSGDSFLLGASLFLTLQTKLLDAEKSRTNVMVCSRCQERCAAHHIPVDESRVPTHHGLCGVRRRVR